MKTIERLRELLAKATPGPLGIDYDNRDGGVDQIVECQSGRTLTVAFGTSDGNEYDLPSLVESRNALPALLAVVEAAEKFRELTERDDDDLMARFKARSDIFAALRALEGGSHE